ncbi:SMI1/KNR4 family protein [uncultured Kordia sp.]|uniref:SMI1/KNR4 family protein n=1 Tax=uncultured Kordia sp. TaxID=507699 RepID=UPI0026129340|nr:SMI1/KNR4 family protein [uncultured Kordia sp.]
MKEQKLNSPLVQKLISKGFYQYSDILEDFNLEKFIESISDLFAPFFSKEYIKENLSIPDEYIQFLKSIGGSLHNGWDYFHGERLVISDTRHWLDLYGEDFKEMETTENVLRLHISIASQGDKQVILLNCDKSSKGVHTYYWFEDAHPWDGYSEGNSDWNSLEAFLIDDYKI